MQQAVGVEGVPLAAVGTEIETESQLGAAGGDLRLVLRHLLGTDAVLGAQVGDHPLPFRRHLRGQLERAEMDSRVHLVAEPLQRLQQAVQTDGTPGAHHIGDKIDLERLGHGEAICV